MSGVYIKTPHSSQYIAICVECIDDYRTNYMEPGDVEMAWPIPGEGTTCENCTNDAGMSQEDIDEARGVSIMERESVGGRSVYYDPKWEGR